MGLKPFFRQGVDAWDEVVGGQVHASGSARPSACNPCATRRLRGARGGGGMGSALEARMTGEEMQQHVIQTSRYKSKHKDHLAFDHRSQEVGHEGIHQK